MANTKDRKKINKKIVVIGGGTGVYTVLNGLKPYCNDLSAIVTMADDGGSTGILREEFGMLPPGDIRRALIALSSSDNKMLADLFSYRFHEGTGLVGHNFGNLLITALHQLTDDFESAIQEAGKILKIQGTIIPVTLAHSSLVAELENGQIIRGESNIDIPNHDGTLKIRKVWLDPPAQVNRNAKRAICDADLVIIGPGDLYTSIIPNLLVAGMREALAKTRGKVAYFVNVMTKYGETNNFSAFDFVDALTRYVGEGVIDYVIANNKKPSPQRLSSYVKERSDLVYVDEDEFPAKRNYTLLTADLLRSKGLVRHDPEKIARIVKMIL